MFFDKDQNEAINLCLDNSRRLVGITGGAGTGKTTIIKEVYNRLIEKEKSVVICAPTGKAAKRITEATGIEAITIHRLLEYPMPDEDQRYFDGPKRNRQNRLDCDIVLCDEYSMVSSELNQNLMAAIPQGGMLRVFGDANQLNPIESISFESKESPFIQILNKFPSVRLTTIHRQGEGSSIITNGAKILNGKIPTADASFRILNTQVKNAIEMIESILGDKDVAEEYFSTNRQFITCSNKGWVGTRKLNQRIQGIRFGLFNDLPFKEIERKRSEEEPTIKLFKGDKIIFTKNDYNLEVYNGETGIVEGFDKKGAVIINFGDRTTAIPETATFFKYRKQLSYNPQQFIDLGYVITTHKSQGSEYEEICYVLDKSQRFMMGKHNFYTAITRAKKRVIVICDIKCLSASVQEEMSK